MDVLCIFAKTLFNAVKAGFSAEDGKPRRPCVGGYDHAVGRNIKNNLYKLLCGETKDGAAVRDNIASFAEFLVYLFNCFKRRRKDEVVYLSGLSALSIDAAYLGGKHEMGGC